jgi:hypothetical protein
MQVGGQHGHQGFDCLIWVKLGLDCRFKGLQERGEHIGLVEVCLENEQELPNDAHFVETLLDIEIFIPAGVNQRNKMVQVCTLYILVSS